MSLLDERKRRIEDAIALKEGDRTPFVYSTNFWGAKQAGVTFRDAMYDMKKYTAATRAALNLLQPDAYSLLLFPLGVALQGLDFVPMKWPGHGIGPNVTFQWLDMELMTAAEYDEFIFDPTGFYLRKYMPRIAKGFKPLEKLPNFPALLEWDLLNAASAFANPEVVEGMQRLAEVGRETLAAQQIVGRFAGEMNAAGFPLIAGAISRAPYDHFADALRGSKGCMLDMRRCPDKLLAAMEKAQVLLLQNVRASTERSGCRYVFIPLHWGLDGFMSPDAFKRFYWPGLRKLMLDLIDMDLVPCPFFEGNCTSRLEIIADIPPGKAIYRFEATDMVKAKEVLGDIVCLRGNVPASLLTAGTADDVDAYCKKLLATVGKGGGFILDGGSGIPDEAKPENVLAMANSVKKYAR